MLKKIIGLTIVALCIANCSFAELRHFPLYGEHQLAEGKMFTQLNGVMVNGQTAEAAKERAYAAARQEAIQYLGSEEALKSHFNAMAKTQKVQELAKRHEALSNITARSSFKVHKTPFDFVQVSSDCFIHWIPGISSESTCEHQSYSEMPRYTKSLFGMYGGEEVQVTLEAENRMVGILIDRFGKDIPIRPVDENHFRTSAVVAVSDQFLSWIMAFDDGVKIVGPERVLTKATEVHHILPLRRGGTHDESNLMPLCKSCHSRISVRDGDRFAPQPLRQE